MIKGKVKEVPIELCFHSPFNTRKTRCQADIEHLAQRIKKYGFEETRALWGRPVNGKYEVFAGGLRLEAMKLLKRRAIPLLPHLDCADEEVAFLTEFDNENDEYHTPISPVDIWAEYARLKSLGWTQQRIADAKHIDRSVISRRLTFHTMSDKVKDFVHKELLAEFHLMEIITLCTVQHLHPWLTTTQAWEELAQKAVHDRGKNGSKPRSL